MHVDLQQFRRQGYLILRNVVPPERLGAMRLVIEQMVDPGKGAFGGRTPTRRPARRCLVRKRPTATDHEFD